MKRRNLITIMAILTAVMMVYYLYSHSESRAIAGLLRRVAVDDDDLEYEYVSDFLTYAQNKDADSMKKILAPNAIAELGEERTDAMISNFLDYYRAGSFKLQEICGPFSDRRIQHGKKCLILEGPVDIETDIGEYRMAIKCIPYDDWDADNVGIWSISIIKRELDTDLSHPYRGDRKFRTGIYFDVERPAV